MTTDDTRQVVERWVDAFNAHDAEGYLALLTDDVEQVSPSERLSGKAAARADIEDSIASQPDASMTVLTLLVTGDAAAVEYRMTGTLLGDIHFGDGRVVPATGRRYDMDGCSLLWLRDGRIATLHHYWDRALMREQIGL